MPSNAGTMFFGNAAYLHLSLAFIQILKALTPGITLIIGLAAGVERLSEPLAASIAAIVVGTGERTAGSMPAFPSALHVTPLIHWSICNRLFCDVKLWSDSFVDVQCTAFCYAGGALVIESGAPHFSGHGVALFVASSVTEAARVVAAQVIMAGGGRAATGKAGGGSSRSAPQQASPLDALVHIGWMSSICLVLGSILWEGSGLAAVGGPLMAAHPGAFVYAAATSFATNLTSFLAIAATSSLTFKVAGCLKNVAVVAYGVAAHGEAVTAWQLAGYAVSAAGFLGYSRYLATARPAAAARAVGATDGTALAKKAS